MSAGYRIRNLAVADLEDIWLFSLDAWNLEQADIYVGSILDCFEWLTENPFTGKERQDIKAGYFCFPVGRHLVFYVLSDGVVEIIGVPHQSMDVVSHLENGDG